MFVAEGAFSDGATKEAVTSAKRPPLLAGGLPSDTVQAVDGGTLPPPDLGCVLQGAAHAWHVRGGMVESASRRRVYLLLTATIQPRAATPFVAVAEPRARLAEYDQALQWYLSTAAPAFERVVFCENSGHDLSLLQQRAQGRGVEFLSFVDDEDVSIRGKGYGELNIVRHALENSEALNDGGLIVKVTGRYVVRNIVRLAAVLGRPPFHQVVADLRQGLSSSDTRICAFTPEFARRFLIPQQEWIDDRRGYFVEHAFARAVHLAMAEGYAWRPWRHEPDIAGIAGGNGFKYRRSPIHRICREAVRRIQWLTLER